MNQLVCAYCDTANELGSQECIACGAPLEITPTITTTSSDPEPFVIRPLSDMNQVDELESVQKALKSASSAYGVVFRILGEALAIALATFGLGMIGAITDQGVWAVLGAVIVGFVVGLVVKNFWPTTLGAPLGTLVGMIIGGIVWGVGIGPQWVILTSTVGAILGAVIGGHRRAAGVIWWDKLRPWLGALGAIFFVALGLLIGEGFQRITRLILG
jgi:hypothetical protein